MWLLWGVEKGDFVCYRFAYGHSPEASAARSKGTWARVVVT